MYKLSSYLLIQNLGDGLAMLNYSMFVVPLDILGNRDIPCSITISYGLCCMCIERYFAGRSSVVKSFKGYISWGSCNIQSISSLTFKYHHIPSLLLY